MNAVIYRGGEEVIVRQHVDTGYEIVITFDKAPYDDHALSHSYIRVFTSTGDDVTFDIFPQGWIQGNVDNLITAYEWCIAKGDKNVKRNLEEREPFKFS